MHRKEVRWLSEWINAGKPEWRAQFAPIGADQKHTCLICGTRGWSGVDVPARWQINCLIGHVPCFRCGIPVCRQLPDCRHTKYHRMRKKSLSSARLPA